MKKLCMIIGLLCSLYLGTITSKAAIVDLGASASTTESVEQPQTTQEGSGEAVTTEEMVTTEEVVTTGEAVTTEQTTQSSVIEEDWSNEIVGDLLPKVDAESFFNRLYAKMFQGLSISQKIAMVVIMFFFVVNCIFLVVGAIGNKGNIGKHILGAFICVLMFFVVINAVPIMSAFNTWANG